MLVQQKFFIALHRSTLEVGSHLVESRNTISWGPVLILNEAYDEFQWLTYNLYIFYYKKSAIFQFNSVHYLFQFNGVYYIPFILFSIIKIMFFHCSVIPLSYTKTHVAME